MAEERSGYDSVYSLNDKPRTAPTTCRLWEPIEKVAGLIVVMMTFSVLNFGKCMEPFLTVTSATPESPSLLPTDHGGGPRGVDRELRRRVGSEAAGWEDAG